MSRGVIRDRLGWENEEEENNFPLLVVTSLGLVYILLITLTIAYLISFTLPLHYPWAGKGRGSLLYFFCLSDQRASEQAIIGVVLFALEPARSNTIFPFLKDASESISKTHLCISIGKPEFSFFLSIRMACYFYYFACLLSVFLFLHCFFLALLLG